MRSAGFSRDSIERLLENQIRYSTAKFTVPSKLERGWEVMKGYFGDAPVDAFTGMYWMLTHPGQIYDAMKCPGKTLEAIGKNIVDTWNSGDRGKGQIVGTVVQSLAGAKALKPAPRGGKYTMSATPTKPIPVKTPLSSGAGNVTRGGANPVQGLQRTGSAVKYPDLYHNFPNTVDNFAPGATTTQLQSGVTLYQIEGSLNGTAGRFEWIVSEGSVTHRLFVPNGTMNGVPIKP